VRDEGEHKGDSEAVGLGASRCCDAEGVKLRRATVDDADFLVELLTHEEVEPYLSAISAKDRKGIVAGIERSEQEPELFGQFIVEVDGRPAGAVRFESPGGPSRIARLGGLAIHPEFRGRKHGEEAARAFQRHLFEDLGFHRLEIEVYGFNERSLAHAERVGWVREGVKRKAYWRHGDWVDGVVFGLLAEDL
jgi:RimJ/RimL family protein N-acetyltransferase